MKVLYVADNRYKQNWGCRATGIALAQLLRTRFTLHATLSGKLLATNFSAYPLGSPSLDQNLRQTLPQPIRGLYRRAAKRFAASVPIITEDPIESAANIRRFAYQDPKLRTILAQLQAADALIINGEGDMVFVTPPRERLLFIFALMELALQFGKPYAYVNGMVSDCPIHGRNPRTAATANHYLTQAAAVSVRDPFSLALIQEIAPQANPTLYPDALFSWLSYYTDVAQQLPTQGDYLIPWVENNDLFGTLDFSQPYLCVSDSSSALLERPEAVSVYVALVNRLKTLNMPLYLIAGSSSRFMIEVSQQTGVPYVPATVPIVSGGAILANARAMISGRYHPSIFASLGGTPCVFLGSNSHKTRSLQDLLGYDDPQEFPVLPDEAQQIAIVQRVEAELAAGQTRRDSIRHAAATQAARVRNLPDHLAQIMMQGVKS